MFYFLLLIFIAASFLNWMIQTDRAEAAKAKVISDQDDITIARLSTYTTPFLRQLDIDTILACGPSTKEIDASIRYQLLIDRVLTTRND
jgi:hypothetical protein